MIAVVLLGIFATIVVVIWKLVMSKRHRPGFAYVYVNQDGSVRELSGEEQAHLKQRFAPADGARPYIKLRYRSLDGWGSQSGYLARHRVPFRIAIQPVHPNFDAAVKDLKEDMLAIHRAAGDVIVRNDNGSVTCTPNPNMSREERMERARAYQLGLAGTSGDVGEGHRMNALAPVDANCPTFVVGGVREPPVVTR